MIANRKDSVSLIKNAFLRIFSSNTLPNKIFAPSIPDKIIICPTNGFYLTTQQFTALMCTLTQSGESSFYLSEVEGENTFISNDKDTIHPYIHLELNKNTSYNEYENSPIILENALYSSSGNWGIFVSCEDFAILGGTHEFVTLFKKNYPQWQQDTKSFIDMWNYNHKQYEAKIDWIPDFLKYINE